MCNYKKYKNSVQIAQNIGLRSTGLYDDQQFIEIRIKTNEIDRIKRVRPPIDKLDYEM